MELTEQLTAGVGCKVGLGAFVRATGGCGKSHLDIQRKPSQSRREPGKNDILRHYQTK